MVYFKKDINKAQVRALINSESEVNAIYPTFAKQLGFPIKPTDVGAQKIDGTSMDTYENVVAAFSVVDKANRVKFFEEIFLVANISPEIVFGMPLLILSSINIDFAGRELRWRTYTTKDVLLTTRRVELMGKKEFAAAALDAEYETYIVHIASFSSIPLIASLRSTPLNVHPFRRPQISGLIAKKAPTKTGAK